MFVLSTFQTNQGVTILKKCQEELNWYLFFTIAIHHRSVMLMSYVIQSCNMRTIGLTFVSFYHEVLEHKGIDNWVWKTKNFIIVVN